MPVIDRGPYAHGANWDLTMATGRALGMLGHGGHRRDRRPVDGDDHDPRGRDRRGPSAQ